MASSVLLVLVIGLTMITASVLNSGYLLAKRDSDGGSSSSDSGSSSPSSSGSNGDNNEKSSGDSGSSSGNNDNNAGNSPDSSPKLKEAQPATPPSETIKENPITPTTPNPKDKPVCLIESCNPVNPNPNPVIGQPDFSCHFHPESPKCAPDSSGNCPTGFSHNGGGNCIPNGPCPKGFRMHDNDESGKCFRTSPFHPHSHVKVIVKEVHHTTTKVVHKNQISGIATVFVPKVGLVEPFNCKLNEDNGKIGCEFLIVKVIK